MEMPCELDFEGGLSAALSPPLLRKRGIQKRHHSLQLRQSLGTCLLVVLQLQREERTFRAALELHAQAWKRRHASRSSQNGTEQRLFGREGVTAVRWGQR